MSGQTRYATRYGHVNRILAEGQKAKRRSKYGNRKVEVDGIKFDSKKEAARYGELLMLQRGGKISNLELQPKFEFPGVLIRSKGYPNGRRASYKADFAYDDNASGEHVVEDVKSVATATEADKLRRALVEHFHSIKVRTL